METYGKVSGSTTEMLSSVFFSTAIDALIMSTSTVVSAYDDSLLTTIIHHTYKYEHNCLSQWVLLPPVSLMCVLVLVRG
eukprot:scaffold286945_cov34-Prasinocladus_malaysianus.AAC.2